jgi:lysophospholipid acyltransferase (LPLAT)-like uncharacterized protein
MSKDRPIAHALAAPIIGALARVLWRTYRVEPVLGEEHANAALRAGRPIIPCYWHQRQFLCVRYVIGLQDSGVKVGFLVSPSKDGELAARVVRAWGAHAIRGSSTRTGAQAIRDLYQGIVRDGISPVITPDGPSGPTCKFKSGTVMLAQLSGAPMLPISYVAKDTWRLRSWDRFMIPRPFTRIAIAVGEPRYVERGLPASALEQIRQKMEDDLNDLGHKAAAVLRNKTDKRYDDAAS